MKVTIEIEDVEAMDPGKANALAVLMAGKLLPFTTPYKPVEAKAPKAEAPEPAKKEARKPRAKAKQVPQEEPVQAEIKMTEEPAKAEPPKEPIPEPVQEVQTEAPKAKAPKAEESKAEPAKEVPAEASTAKVRTVEELRPLIRKYCLTHMGGVDTVQSQFKGLGIKALDEATPEQLNIIAERLGV